MVWASLTNFIQGFGNPVSKLNNRPLAAFAQDSWKIRPNFTINYGVRYDYEVTKQIPPTDFTDPLSGILVARGTDAGLLRRLRYTAGLPARP